MKNKEKIRFTYKGLVLEGVFISRVNRFVAEVELDGELVLAHVKNTGRMRELLTQGSRCYVQVADSPNRKTKYDLLSIEYKGILVNLDTQVSNKLAEKAFRENAIKGFEKLDSVRSEVSVGRSRLDFLLERDGVETYVEVKSVDLVLNGEEAMFPGAPTERGQRHLRDLIKLVQQGKEAMVFFLVAREDCKFFRPHYTMDPAFVESFYLALEVGVQARAYNTTVGIDYIQLDSKIPLLNKDEMMERVALEPYK